MSGAAFDRRRSTRLHRYPAIRDQGQAEPLGSGAEPAREAPTEHLPSSDDADGQAKPSRQSWRNAGLVLGLLAIGWLIVEGAPMAWNRATLLRAQSQCMAYPGPEGLPVGRAPDCWINYCAQAGIPDASYDHVLFLHGMRSKGGTERLVVIKEGPPRWINEGLYPPRPTWASVATVGWIGRPMGTQGQRHQAFPRNDSFPRPKPSREMDGVLHRPEESYFAGSMDPDDPSHFRIRYRVEGWEIRYSGKYRWFGGVGLIEGWLQDDGTVRMQFTQTDPIPPPPDAPAAAAETALVDAAEPAEPPPPASSRPTRPPPPANRVRE
jgi:hypothetical protein